MNPHEIAELALASAREGFDQSVQALIDAVEGDPEVLLAASRIVSEHAATAEGPEHIAFTYLTAAYRQLTGT